MYNRSFYPVSFEVWQRYHFVPPFPQLDCLWLVDRNPFSFLIKQIWTISNNTLYKYIKHPCTSFFSKLALFFLSFLRLYIVYSFVYLWLYVREPKRWQSADCCGATVSCDVRLSAGAMLSRRSAAQYYSHNMRRRRTVHRVPCSSCNWTLTTLVLSCEDVILWSRRTLCRASPFSCFVITAIPVS